MATKKWLKDLGKCDRVLGESNFVGKTLEYGIVHRPATARCSELGP